MTSYTLHYVIVIFSFVHGVVSDAVEVVLVAFVITVVGSIAHLRDGYAFGPVGAHEHPGQLCRVADN